MIYNPQQTINWVDPNAKIYLCPLFSTYTCFHLFSWKAMNNLKWGFRIRNRHYSAVFSLTYSDYVLFIQFFFCTILEHTRNETQPALFPHGYSHFLSTDTWQIAINILKKISKDYYILQLSSLPNVSSVRMIANRNPTNCIL